LASERVTDWAPHQQSSKGKVSQECWALVIRLICCYYYFCYYYYYHYVVIVVVGVGVVVVVVVVTMLLLFLLLLLLLIIKIIMISTTVSSIYQRAPAVIRGSRPVLRCRQRVGGARRACAPCHSPARVAGYCVAGYCCRAALPHTAAGDGGHLWLARRRAYFPRVRQGTWVRICQDN
jgi:hypothetical protein